MVEYVQILGGPASAFNGALSQVIADWNLGLSMRKPTNGRRERDLILIVMLVDQANFGTASVREALEIMAGSDWAREYSLIAGRVIWSARKKFNNLSGAARGILYRCCSCGLLRHLPEARQ